MVITKEFDALITRLFSIELAHFGDELITKAVLYLGERSSLTRKLVSALFPNNAPTDFVAITNQQAFIAQLKCRSWDLVITEKKLPASAELALSDCQPVPELLICDEEEPAFCETSETVTAQVLDAIPAPIFYKNEQGVYTGCNTAFAEYLGLPKNKIIGGTVYDVAPGEHAQTYHQADLDLMEQGGTQIYETKVRSADEVEHDVIFHKAVLESGGLVGAILDVSKHKRTERLLENKRALLKAMVDAIPDLIFFKDPQSRFMGCNRAFEAFVGGPESDILGRKDEDLFHLEQAEMCQQQDAEVVASATRLRNEEVLTFHDGEERLIDMLKVPYFDKEGKVLGLIGVGRDISEQRRSEKRLKRAATVFENTREGIMVTDEKGNILSVNPAFSRITGYSESEVLNKNTRLLRSGEHTEEFYQQMWRELQVLGSWHGEIVNRRKNGELFHEWLNINSVPGKDGQLVNYVGTFTDLSLLKKSEQKLQFLSQHDALTGVANRLSFAARLRDAMNRAKRNLLTTAVMWVDIDRFKRINDGFGYDFGDKVLKEVANRLQTCIREKDTVARIGSDEFVLLIDELKHEQDAALIAKKILQNLACGLEIDGHTMYLCAGIGISLFPDDGETTESLLANAETAMSRAKNDHLCSYHFYTEELTAAAQKQFELEGELRRAVNNEEFELYYQPQLNLIDKRVVGVEALLRWRHLERGLLIPLNFLPVAEESGLILPIGDWVFRQACLQAVSWSKQGLEFGRLAINLSRRQLCHAGLLAEVMSTLKETQCKSNWLEFEVAEDFLLSDTSIVLDNLRSLKMLGINLVIDDFGTGISSLINLKHIEVDKFKIAREFIQEVAVDPVSQAIVKSIISLGASLGVDVVAEGAETDVQVDSVRSLQCTQMQGYYHAKPLRKAEASFFLRCKR